MRKRVPYKPDRFQRLAGPVGEWARRSVSWLSLSLVAALVAFVVGAVLLKGRAASEDAAWAALYRAGPDVEKLEEALSAYRGSAAGPYITFALARSRMDQRTEEGRKNAEELLEELLREHAEHYLKLYALECLSAVQEEDGRYREAIETLKTALESDPGTLEPKLHYDIGRNYARLGDVESATIHLERAAMSNVMVTDVMFGRVRQVVPPWRENTEYLLARLGHRE